MSFIKNLLYGKPPTLIGKGISTGNLTRATLENFHKKIENLLSQYDNVKIGKTGQPKSRADKKDYRRSYDKMYLLYKSENRTKIDNLEVRLIKEYFDELDNETDKKGGNMVSRKGKYYIYVVVR